MVPKLLRGELLSIFLDFKHFPGRHLSLFLIIWIQKHWGSESYLIGSIMEEMTPNELFFIIFFNNLTKITKILLDFSLKVSIAPIKSSIFSQIGL